MGAKSSTIRETYDLSNEITAMNKDLVTIREARKVSFGIFLDHYLHSDDSSEMIPVMVFDQKHDCCDMIWYTDYSVMILHEEEVLCEIYKSSGLYHRKINLPSHVNIENKIQKIIHKDLYTALIQYMQIMKYLDVLQKDLLKLFLKEVRPFVEKENYPEKGDRQIKFGKYTIEFRYGINNVYEYLCINNNTLVFDYKQNKITIEDYPSEKTDIYISNEFYEKLDKYNDLFEYSTFAENVLEKRISEDIK